MVLFTLLVQGLTTQFVLKALDLIGDQPQRREYAELIARQVTLKQVLKQLQNSEDYPDTEAKLFRYKQEPVEEELASLGDKLQKLLTDYPQLREVARQNFDAALI